MIIITVMSMTIKCNNRRFDYFTIQASLLTVPRRPQECLQLLNHGNGPIVSCHMEYIMNDSAEYSISFSRRDYHNLLPQHS